jgi:hypothetical protein
MIDKLNSFNDMDEITDFFNIINNINNKYYKVISQYFPKDWEDLKNDIASFTKNYKEKINEARKLRIGIVGQIKAGKSTFLNCLFFEGKDILPKAVTPMTASLTYLSYADNPHVEVEFFDEDDMIEIERESKESTDKTYKKILIDIKEPGIKDLISKKTVSLDFSDISNLKENLKDYISESGIYTNLIKSVSIYLNYEPIRHIEIIDTPGFNDPIVSRSRKTQKFVETCDILLLLSRASQFLETSDMELLAQTYKRKSAIVYAVASKFDSVLDDAVATKKNQDIEFNDLFKKELTKRESEFKSILNKHENEGGIDEGIIKEKLLYFSSSFHKKLNNIPLSSDEEKPIKKLSDKTHNFYINSDFSGFDSIKKIIDSYKEEKNVNAVKSKIIKDYIQNRTESLKKNVNAFIDNVSELLNKKTGSVKKDIGDLELARESFQKDKEKIGESVLEVYFDYLGEFLTETKSLYVNFESNIKKGFSTDTLKEYSAETHTETTSKKIPKSDLFSKIFRFFNSTEWGYETIPVKTSYKYYNRDLIISMLSGFIDRISDRINNQIKKTFNINKIKSKIIDILNKNGLQGHLINQAVDISVKTPENVNIKSNSVIKLFYDLKIKDAEIKDESLFHIIEETGTNLIDFIKNYINDLEKSMKEQTNGQRRKMMTAIEDYFMQNINSLNKRKDLKEEEINILNNELNSLINELEKIKRFEILN